MENAEVAHRLPVNTLKVDRSFVGRMDEAAEYREIVRTIVSLAHTLGLDVVAEGVETAAQWSQLSALNCEYSQGYFFAKPLSDDAATKYLAESHGAPALVQPIDREQSYSEPVENYFM